MSIKAKYGLLEVFGTLATYIKWKLTKDPEKRKAILKKGNPLNQKNAMYCIAFVDLCMEAGGITYCDKGIDNELLTVDHGWVSQNTPHLASLFENPKID